MTNSNNEIWLVALGAVLAFTGGLVGFFIQWWWGQKTQKNIVAIFTREILMDFDRIFPRVIENYEKSGILWNDLLNQIADGLSLYERNKEHSIVIKDPSLRAELWDWFSRARTTVNTSYNLNRLLGDPAHPDWVKTEIPKQVLKLKELKVDAQKLIQKLK